MSDNSAVVMSLDYKKAIERMAEAGAKDSLPIDGMFNSEQLDSMRFDRMETYKRIAQVMLEALLTGGK